MLLAAAALLLSTSASSQDEVLLKEADHRKIGKEIASCIEAFSEGKGRIKAEEDLKEALDKWTKKKQFKDRDPLSSPADLGACLWHAMEYDKKKVKKGKVQSVTVETGPPFNYELEYCVWAPSKYKSKSGPYPLILCIPDAGQRPFDHLTEDWALGDLRDGVILAAISMPDDVEAWKKVGGAGEPGGLANLFTVFKEMTRNYAVDFDKVFIAGKGAGVSAALELAQFFPDRFAGVIGRTGDAGSASHANYRNLPVFFAGGGKEATAFGEAMQEADFAEVVIQPDAREEDIFSWIKEVSRDANPRSVSLSPKLPFPNKAYWIEVPVAEETEGRVIHAELDPSTNEINVTAKHVSSVTIYFNDTLVDLDLPVTVICNGVRNEDLIPRNFSVMMRLIYSARNDAGRFYTASREYDIPQLAEEDEG